MNFNESISTLSDYSYNNEHYETKAHQIDK